MPWKRLSALVLSSALAALASVLLGAAPAGAKSTTTVTSARCDVATATVTVTWEGKTPFSYRVFFVTRLFGLPARAEGYVDNSSNKTDTWTWTMNTAPNWSPVPGDSPTHVLVSLFAKPHGNIEPFFPHHGPELYDAEVPCT